MEKWLSPGLREGKEKNELGLFRYTRKSEKKVLKEWTELRSVSAEVIQKSVYHHGREAVVRRSYGQMIK